MAEESAAATGVIGVSVRSPVSVRPDQARPSWIVYLTTFALALVLGTAPSTSCAQEARKIWRIGLLTEGPRSMSVLLPAELRALGWVQNENFVFERRHAEGHPDRLPELAADLVRAKPDLILAFGNPETEAAKRATSSIPIIMMFGLQALETGLVPSLARPGGNVTGMVWVTPEYVGKILQVFKEAVPKARTVAVLWDPTNPGHSPEVRAEFERAGRTLGVTLRYVDVRTVDDFDQAFATLAKLRPDGVLVGTTPVVQMRRDDVLAFMVKHRLPAFYSGRGFVDAGGLGSYAPSFAEHYRRIATFVDRILRGARPADLPIEQPTKFELVINLKNAKAIGLTIPPSLLVRVDQVIE
jgi:putative ABC transport system substrate-binding protein